MPAGGLALLKDTLVPAGGESFLLMHARWKKLEQDIYHPRKGRFDISKVPDVYDAAKYDAIHNSHLSLDGLEELYRVSRCLAEGVVPNEYGTHPQSKLRIGGTIAHSLLVKLLQDMHTTREESFVGMPQSRMEHSTYGDSESDSTATKADGGGSGRDGRRTRGDDQRERRRLGANVWGGRGGCRRAQGRRGDRAQYDAPEPSLCQRAGRELAHRHVRTRLYFLRRCASTRCSTSSGIVTWRSRSSGPTRSWTSRAPLDRLRVSSRVRSRPWITSVTSII